jgi:hypothetical protein
MEKRKTRAPHGFAGYANVIRFLFDEPKTCTQIAEHFGITKASAQAMMRQCVTAKIVHVADWHKNPGERGLWVAMYKYGEGQEAAYPGKKRPVKHERKNNIRPNLLAVRHILTALEHPISMKGLIEITGCGYGAIHGMVTQLRKRGICRIAEYVPRLGHAGCPERLFVLGRGPDAKKPPRMCEKDRAKRRYWAKKARMEQQAMIMATAGNDSIWSNAA